MSNEKREPAREDSAEARESGLPGGGVGRRDEVGGSGVYPASAGSAPGDAVPRGQAGWGQGDRGAAGYEDSGSSELFFYESELRAAGIEPEAEKPEEGKDPEEGKEPPAAGEEVRGGGA